MIDRKFSGGYGPDETMMVVYAIGQPNLSYEFNDFILWKDTLGSGYYFATDSGCSCPTPFEGYTTLSSLTRVESADHALRELLSWGDHFLTPDDIDEAKREFAKLDFSVTP